MFNSPDYPKSLDETLFEEWLEKGRESKIRYNFLLIVWDELHTTYKAKYVSERSEIDRYELFGAATTSESLVAVYDLYSESRISIHRT
ncbi:MAG: hypothetical protein JXQ90_03480 [Cyclobacteriaceae bacterium]